MGNQVDVLAVLASAQTFATAYHLPNSASDYEQAIDAVAELIAAASAALRREEFKQGEDAGNDGLVRSLRAALARCGGEA